MNSEFPPKSGLYSGTVIHRRVTPIKHNLKYRVFSLFLDLDDLESYQTNLRLFSINKFNLFSFFNKDHCSKDMNLSNFLRQQISNRYPSEDIYKIFILCFPRVLGYVFNPLSVYFCYNHNHDLRVIIYEVSNTFGEKYNYFFPICDQSHKYYSHSCNKAFYVSPFLEMELAYKFKTMHPSHNYRISIRAFHNSELRLVAFQEMKRIPFTDGLLLREFFLIPFMPFKVIMGIHLDALILWYKGLKIFPRIRTKISDDLAITNNPARTEQ